MLHPRHDCQCWPWLIRVALLIWCSSCCNEQHAATSLTMSSCSLQDTACFSGRIDSQLAEASDPNARILKRSGFAGMNSEVGLAAVKHVLWSAIRDATPAGCLASKALAQRTGSTCGIASQRQHHSVFEHEAIRWQKQLQQAPALHL